MRLRSVFVASVIAVGSIAGAQVSGGGSTGVVPKFTGSSTIGNSVITESNGSIGIGTASPQTTLDVNGNVRSLGSSGYNFSSNADVWLREGYGLNVGVGGNTATYAARFLNTSGTTLMSVRGDGTVGIGTTSPNDMVDISSGSPAFRLSFGQEPANYFSRAFIHVDGSGNANLGYLGFQVHNFPGSTVTPMVLTGAGNVGIGTTSPGQVLTVNGSIQSILDNDTIQGRRNVVGIVPLGYSGITGAQNWSLRGVYQYGNGVNLNATGGDLDIIKSLNANTILATKTDGTSLGNVGIGTTTPSAKLDVNGSVKISGSGASMTFPDGTVQATAWNGTTCGGDYAESIDVTGDRKTYEPGDVLVVDPKVEGKFLKSSEPYATTVMGIYSTQPGLTGRRVGAQKTGEEVPMAMLGIVPTKVSAENGSIKPGDLLVTSSTPGYAMKATDRSRMVGALIGKALGHLDAGTGVIEVGIALQ